MKRLAALLLASSCLVIPTPAHAEPITIALASTIGVTLTAGSVAASVATIALTTAVGIGISLAANALLAKPSELAADTTSGGSELSVTYGAAQPRSAIMGPGATGGHHIYTNVYGATNEWLQCVFVIGDGKHGKVTRLQYNGKNCTLPAGGLSPSHGAYALPEFIVPIGPTPLVSVTYYDGRYDQNADGSLVANSNPPGRWTTDHRGRGVAYLVINQFYGEGEWNTTSVPSLLIETEGLMLYDPRKDSTNGGSGPHRWAQVDTYEPSANPAVQEYNFRRGILVNGQRLLGMAMSPVNLILQMYFTAMNDNDFPIPLAEGGTEPRYRCSITIHDDRAASDVLSSLRSATAGWSLERGGQFGPVSGLPQVPVASLAFTDDDMIVGAAASFTKYRSRSEIVTATFGQFSDPAQFWVSAAFPPRENAADDALMGERIAKSLDLTQVYSPSQAQRIAESERRKTLQEGQGVATLPAKWIGVQPGDWLPFNSARHGNMTVLVTGTTLDTAKQQITITFERTSNTVYSWTTAGELFPPEVGAGGTTGFLIMLAQGMTAVGVNIPGDNGLVTPGIHFTWNSIFDPTVEQIDFEIRRVGDSNVLPFTAEFPAGGSAVCSGHGITAATNYEYRHKLFTFPDRGAPWSAWLTVTSGSDFIVSAAVTQGDVHFEDIIGEIVSGQIANAAVTSQKIAAAAVTQTAFAAGIEPVGTVATLPAVAGYTGPRTVFNTTDKKLYRYTGTEWVRAVDGLGPGNTLTAAQIAAGSGANKVPNSDFLGGVIGVSIAGNNTGQTPTVPAIWPGTTWHPDGMNSVFFNFPGTPPNNTFCDLAFQPPTTASQFGNYWPVIAGRRYEFSAYLSEHRCAADFMVVWVNNAGAYVGENHGNLIVNNLQGGALANWARSAGFGVAPASAVQCYLIVRTYYQTALGLSANPYTFVTGLFLGEAGDNQTEFTPWAPAGQTVISGSQVITGSVTALQIMADTITTNQLAAQTIQAADIAAETITAGQIAAGAISTSELQANAVTAGIIAGGAITANKLAVGTGSGNRCSNSDFWGGIKGVVLQNWNTGQTPDPLSQSIFWSPTGMNCVYAHWSGAAPPANGTIADLWFYKVDTTGALKQYPVARGKKYEFSFYVSIHRMTCDAAIFWYSADGTYQGENHGPRITQEGAGNTSMSNFPRAWVIATAPNGADQAVVAVRMYFDGRADNYCFVSGLFFADGSDNMEVSAAALTPWSPAGATVIDGGSIVTNTITGDRIVANAIDAGKIAAGSIFATHIGANQVITQTGNIGDLVVTNAKIADLTVDNIKIRDAAITVPGFQAGGFVGCGPGAGEQLLAQVVLVLRGVGGKTVWINAQVTGLISPISPPTFGSVRLVINGGTANGVDQEANQGITTYSMIGSTSFGASGGDQVISCEVYGHVNFGLTGASIAASLFAVAYLR